jgi:hypothetical protein
MDEKINASNLHPNAGGRAVFTTLAPTPNPSTKTRGRPRVRPFLCVGRKMRYHRVLHMIVRWLARSLAIAPLPSWGEVRAERGQQAREGDFFVRPSATSEQ